MLWLSVGTNSEWLYTETVMLYGGQIANVTTVMYHYVTGQKVGTSYALKCVKIFGSLHVSVAAWLPIWSEAALPHSHRNHLFIHDNTYIPEYMYVKVEKITQPQLKKCRNVNEGFEPISNPPRHLERKVISSTCQKRLSAWQEGRTLLVMSKNDAEYYDTQRGCFRTRKGAEHKNTQCGVSKGATFDMAGGILAVLKEKNSAWQGSLLPSRGEVVGRRETWQGSPSSSPAFLL